MAGQAILVSMMRIIACAQGRVQGVGYCSFAGECARGTGVTGFARDMPGGSGTIVAEGSDEAPDLTVTVVQAPGTTCIRVDTPFVTRCKASGEFSGFRIRASAVMPEHIVRNGKNR